MVTAVTNPPSLAVTIAYDGSPVPPTNAGTYAVSAMIDDVDYQGVANGSLVVAKAQAVVSLGNLVRDYDGTPQVVTATTEPAGLTVAVTYAGSPTPPSDLGLYPVTATVVERNYQGSASGTLSILAESLSDWRARYFTPEQIASGQAADSADPDCDGLVNLAEYALGTNPLSATPSLTGAKNPDGLVLTFQRPKGLPDVSYAAESSEDTLHWNPCLLEVVVDGPVQSMRARDPLASGDPARRFIRLKFTRQ
jgi:hypothetical protein